MQIKEDPEWEQFSMVPNLVEGWNDVRDKLNGYTEEFKVWICSLLLHYKNPLAAVSDSSNDVSLYWQISFCRWLY